MWRQGEDERSRAEKRTPAIEIDDRYYLISFRLRPWDLGELYLPTRQPTFRPAALFLALSPHERACLLGAMPRSHANFRCCCLRTREWTSRAHAGRACLMLTDATSLRCESAGP